jgi:hypothetical protein
MQILIKKCDMCERDIRNDSAEYNLFSVLEEPTGSRRDVCPPCVAKLTPEEAPHA